MKTFKIIILALIALFSTKSIAQSLEEMWRKLEKQGIQKEKLINEYNKMLDKNQKEWGESQLSALNSATYLRLENDKFITTYINGDIAMYDELELITELKRRNQFGPNPLYEEVKYDELLKAFRQNCKKRPGKKIIGCLLGECTNGMGYYVSPLGNKYIGESVSNLKTGFGVMFYSDGGIYAGEWSNDKFNWNGIYITATSIYYGEWKEGKSVGKGTYICSQYECVGKWKDGLMNGKGLIKYKNGVKYEGEFKDNMYNGMGTYTFPDGRILEGRFDNGKFVNNKQATN